MLCWNGRLAVCVGTLAVHYPPPSAMRTAHELSLHLIASWRIYDGASVGGGGAPKERWVGEWEGVKQEEWEVAKTKKV